MPVLRRFLTARLRVALPLLVAVLVLASCSLTNKPAPTAAPPTAAVPSVPTAAAVRGTVPVTLPTVIAGGIPGSPPGSFNLPPNLPVQVGDQVKVDSVLFDIAVIYQQQGRAAAEQAARDAGVLNTNNEVRLTLYLTDTNREPVEAKIKELGGRVVASSDNVIDLVISLDALSAAAANNPVAQLAAFTTVKEIKATPLMNPQGLLFPASMTREERKAQLALIVSEGVKVTGADQWHAAGITGKGIKVGIIDAGFVGYESLLGQELPAKVTARAFGSTNDITGGGEAHGTAVAEIVHAMAPDAELFLAQVEGPAGVANATDFLMQQGVKVIQMSLGRGGETRGDGSGPWAKPVDKARAAGVLFVVAAGNDGDAHYTGTFTDADGDGWHDFAPGEPGLKVGVGSVLDVVMRWDAWTGNAPNLDLYIFNGDGSQLLASSRNVQGAGQQKDPVEKIGIPLRREFQGQTFLIGIRAVGTVPPVKVEIFTKNSELELFTPVGSVATPGDAKGAFTVGATNFKNGKLETFSGQGPTVDNRQKPDISGPDRVTTAAYSKEDPANPAFPGTSAACPHVSGAAALVYSMLGANATPDQVQQFLISRAKDIDDPGPDNKSGAGDLRLGAPSGQQGNTPPPSAAPRASAQPSTAPRASAPPAAGGPKLAVTPGSGPSGTKFTIKGTGFSKNSKLPAEIHDANDNVIANGEVTVSADGAIQTAYDSTGDPDGQYTVLIGDSAGNVIATATYTVGAGGAAPPLPSAAPRPSAAPSTAPRASAAPSTAPRASAAPRAAPVIAVSPNAGPAGTKFGFSGAGFTPSTKLIIGIFNEAGEVIASAEITSSATGTVQVSFDSTGSPPGPYRVGIFTADGKTNLAQAQYTVR